MTVANQQLVRLEAGKAEQAKTTRSKLWEISPRFHCSLVGTCVQMSELRQVIKRCNIHLPDDASEYSLHSTFVNMADIPSPAMRMLQKMVDRRYTTEIKAFAKAKSSQEMEQLWYEFFDRGKIAGAYWALMSHPALERQLASQVHGEIHMLSHQASITWQADRRRLSRQKQQLDELEKQLAKASAILRETVQERDLALEKLKSALRDALQTRTQLVASTQQLEALQRAQGVQQLQQELQQVRDENENLRTIVNKTERERDRYRQRYDISEGRNQTLLGELQKLRKNPAQEWPQLAQQDALYGKSSAPCPTPADATEQLDLCGRCVLVVGGRTGQCEHYRSLVEKHNGRFMHHDGGREDSRQRLGNILQQADAVLCPLDNISHDAINRVKRYCEQNTKHLVLMPRSSLSTFANSLRQVAK